MLIWHRDWNDAITSVFQVDKTWKWGFNDLVQAQLHICSDDAGCLHTVFGIFNMTHWSLQYIRKNFYNKTVYGNKYSRKSAITKVLKCPPLVLVHGVNADCTGLIIWFLSMSRSLVQKNGLYFPPLPKTITPPNAAPASQLRSNRSSAFEVFMDINDPTFQKSSTCLA